MPPAARLTAQIIAARDQRVIIAGHFDHAHYAAQHPDLTLTGGDGPLHFLIWGWRQGVNPNPDFDVAYYLKANPDVALEGINPLVHYLLHGRDEGRLPRRPHYPWQETLERAWRHASDSEIHAPRPIPMRTDAELREILDHAHDAGLALVAGPQAGGPQPPDGWTVLNLRSCMPTTALAPASPATGTAMELSPNGAAFGGVLLSGLMEVLAGIVASGRPVRLICHHLGGFAPEHLAALAGLCTHPPLVWEQDAFLTCPSPGLLRNDLTPCGAPPPDSAACTICCHGPARQEHLARLSVLLTGATMDGGGGVAGG